MVELVNASIRIESITTPQRSPCAGPGTAGAGFTVPVEEADAASSSRVTTGQVGAANPVLLHQLAIGADEAHDREAHRHGKEVLDLLAELHRMLLCNRQDAGLCDRLAGLVRRPPAAASPALTAVTGGIVLRARVELARLATRSSPQD